MKETWKPVPYEPFNKRYLVSNLGRIKPIKKSKYSTLKGECLKAGLGARGYPCYTLYANGMSKQVFGHRTVALVFLGEPPVGKNIVCHLDDNKQNNCVTNLIWGSSSDNMRHMVERGRSLTGSKNPRALLNDVKVQKIRDLYSEGGVSQQSLALQFGVHQTQISRIVRDEHWAKS